MILRNTWKHVVMLLVVGVLCGLTTVASAQAINSAEKEKELIALLQSDAPKADKAIACKQLAIHGSDAAVAELARLLPDEQLSSWSRIALEAIPGSTADEALRKAAESLSGRLLVGTLNSIGVRKDRSAVELLVGRLQDADTEVAAAAAVALGHIGNEPAAKALRAALTVGPAPVRSAAAEGCILCAEKLLGQGEAAQALELYEEVRKAELPQQRILEATRGSILARRDEGVALLIEQLRGDNKALFQIALSTARELEGNKVDQALAEELGTTSPEKAVAILQTMADRPATVELPAVLKLAAKGAPAVQLAAITALGRVGNQTCLPTLLTLATEENQQLSAAARQALADLPGEQVNAQILEQLDQSANAKTYPVLLSLVGQRRLAAQPALLKALQSQDAPIREAALAALGETVDLEGLTILIEKTVAPGTASDLPAAQRALMAASVRMPDREACAAKLAAAVSAAKDAKTKGNLLQILGAVGGTKALEAVAAAARTSDATLQDISSRLLGEWMTADAAPVLYDLAHDTPPGYRYQVRAVRGYIRIARQFILPEATRAEMCSNALEIARQPAEKKMVLDVLKRYPNAATFKIAVAAAQDPDVKNDATPVVLSIAQKLGISSEALKETLAKLPMEKVKLEIVKAQFGAGDLQKDVTEIVRQHAGEVALIVLPQANFNSTFGGDPAPNMPKQLKVQYRINGKDAEVSIPENGLILLPMPK